MNIAGRRMQTHAWAAETGKGQKSTMNSHSRAVSVQHSDVGSTLPPVM
ncbi:hypothetical protein [Caballeronia sp. DA-9]